MTDSRETGTSNAADEPEAKDVTGQRYTSAGSDLRQSYDQLDNESAQIMAAMPDNVTAGAAQLSARTGIPLRIVLHRLHLLERADLAHRRDDGVTLARNNGQVDMVLSDLISTYCAAQPDQPLEPGEIARGITAATGRPLDDDAVRNYCLLLASTGRLLQVAEAPVTFAFPTRPATQGGALKS
ncbi:hypothetical protein [Actinoplanes sp. NPDC020271]|uniref:hypothetical protein n=1 Tax=Actinoplanes sp. NPDC020271 TaxID=3363896 RepID=UPI003799C98A